MCLNEMANLKISEKTGLTNVEFTDQVSKTEKDVIYKKIFKHRKAHTVPPFKSIIHFSSRKKMIITDRTEYGQIREMKRLPKLYPNPKC